LAPPFLVTKKGGNARRGGAGAPPLQERPGQKRGGRTGDRGRGTGKDAARPAQKRLRTDEILSPGRLPSLVPPSPLVSLSAFLLQRQAASRKQEQDSIGESGNRGIGKPENRETCWFSVPIRLGIANSPLSHRRFAQNAQYCSSRSSARDSRQRQQ